MSGVITTIVNAISNDVVAGLATLGLPALSDGKILLGSANVAVQGAPPRIVFEPVSSRFGAADKSVAATMATLVRPYTYDPDLLAVLQARTLATEFVKFRVHVWGISNPTPGSPQDPGADLDAVDSLKRVVLLSLARLGPSITVEDSCVWANSARPQDAALVVTGWYLNFLAEIATPVTDYPIQFAQTGATAPGVQITTAIQPGDGSASENGPVITR